jgi:SCP-2 sterol transfer family
MAHFESDAEVYEELGGIFNNLVGNAGRLEQLRQADAIVQFAFRGPDATVTLDVRAGKRPRVDLGATQLRPDVVLAMEADTGRALLNGELHPTVALARGDVRTKGPVAKILRVVPATAAAQGVERDLPEEEPEVEPAPEAEAPAVDERAATAAEPEAPEAEPEAPAAETEAPAADEARATAAEPDTAEPEAPAADEATVAEPEAPAAEPEAPAAEPQPDAEAAPQPDPAPEAEAPASENS